LPRPNRTSRMRRISRQFRIWAT